jgi:hypothetical protein
LRDLRWKASFWLLALLRRRWNLMGGDDWHGLLLYR